MDVRVKPAHDGWGNQINRNSLRAYAPLPARPADWIAFQIRSLVAGMSSSRTPQPASAFMIAIMTAGSATAHLASLAPLARSGLRAVGTGLLTILTLHIVSARGMQ